MDILLIERTQSAYPERLRPLPDMPERLYVRGSLPGDDRPALAIVGARSCSTYGENMAFEYARTLARSGVQIISGMAAGIDSAAHRGALAGGGKTFAVLGCGVDVCYPASARKIYEKLPEAGGILSEYGEGTPPLAYHFPQRNRIISALADAVLIVEARMKSGSLITADWALEMGRTVFALPGRVGDLLSEGTNRLIYQGAVPAWQPKVILEEMGWEEKEDRLDVQKNKNNLATAEKLVYSCLDLTPKNLAKLQEQSQMPAGELMTQLLSLMQKELARECWKGYYIRS